MSSFKSAPSSGGFWSIERVVAALTPVFAAAAGWVSTIVAHNIPGLTIPRDQIVAVFIGGATAATAAALKWLHGRQKFVSFTTDADHVVDQVVKRAQGIGGAPLMEIEHLLSTHEAAIVKALGDKIGATPSVELVAEEVVKRLIGQQAKAAPTVAPTP